MPLTTVQLGMQGTPQFYGFKNRIINGAMVISQRGTSFSYSNSTNYSLDRWSVRCGSNGGVPNTATVTQSSVAPSGFNNSLLYTVGTARTVVSGDRNGIEQSIEGYNVADLGWGTASAKSITLSFWVRSSLTGTFGLCFSNFSRGYAATYTISSANTWEYKTVSIVGDTSGTWNTTNSTGFLISFDLGMGSDVRESLGSWQEGTFLGATGATNVVATAGATFAITGCQIEVGVTATSFDYRSIGTELQLCQRYYAKLTHDGTGNEVLLAIGIQTSTTDTWCYVKYPVTMRTEPTASISSLRLSNFRSFSSTATLTAIYPGFDTGTIRCSMTAGGSPDLPIFLQIENGTAGFIALSSEL
jgi:hypothetical protein